MKNCKVQKLYTILAPVLVFVTLLFSCPLIVHADDPVPLPYSPGMIEGYILTSQELTSLQSLINEINGGVDLSNDNVIIFKSQETLWWTWSEMTTVPYYTIYQLDSTQYLTSSFSTAKTFLTFDLYDQYCSIDVTMPAGKKFVFYPRGGIGNLSNGNWSGEQLSSPANSVVRFYGSATPTSVSNNYYDFVWYDYYPIYCNGEFTTIDRDSFPGIFLTSNLQEQPADPTPTDPDDPDPITPDIPDPDFPDLPNNSTLDDYLEWIGGILIEIGNWFSGFGSWLKGALNKIITNIVNGFSSVIANFKSLFKPFIDKALEFYDSISQIIETAIDDLLSILEDIKACLTSVKTFFDTIISLGTSNGTFSLTTLFVNLFIPSSSDVKSAFENSDTFGLISFGTILWIKILDIRSTINNLSQSKILHVPSLIYHGQQIGNFDISFAWFDNYKVYSDGIISAFLIFTYFWFLIFRLPTFIRGQGQISGLASSIASSNVNNGGDHH